jgi:hypothetical protein
MNGVREADMGDVGFDLVLDAVEKLSLDEQETLVDILTHRIAAHRRTELAKDVRDAEEEFRQGGCSPITPGELMKEILE